MFQGMIERAMTRRTQRDDPEAREAGRSWAMDRVGQAMDAAEAREPQASREQQTRRRWMGNWVASGDREGYREPGNFSGNQPPRPSTDVDRDQLRSTILERFQNIADQQGGPFGADGSMGRTGSNITQALASSNLPQSLASLRSRQGMMGSLGGSALNFRDPDRAQPGATGGMSGGTRDGLFSGLAGAGDFDNGFIGRMASRLLDGLSGFGATTTPSSIQQAARDSLAAGQDNFRRGGSAMAENADTVQGQMQDLMSQDNNLMKQARTQGLQKANQRGLLNSSMAVGASQDAMMRNAMPMATQDAGALQDLNKLQASSAANAWGVMANNVTDIVAQGMEGIANINANPDIKEKDKTKMIGQITDMRDTDIQFQQNLYEGLSSYLADTNLFPNL